MNANKSKDENKYHATKMKFLAIWFSLSYFLCFGREHFLLQESQKKKTKKHFSWRITLMFHWHCKKESLLFVVWIVFGQFCIIDHFGCSTQIKPWSKPISLQTYWKLYQYAKASACLLTNRAYKPSLWMSSICFPICIVAQKKIIFMLETQMEKGDLYFI